MEYREKCLIIIGHALSSKLPANDESHQTGMK